MKTPFSKSVLLCTIWLALYVIVLFLLTLCWVGAEYIFEGHVHSSDVDGVIAYILAYFITRAVWPFDKEVGKRVPRDHHHQV